MSSDLQYARLAYASDLVVGVTFGIYVVLAAICIHFLLRHRNTTISHRIILWYTVTMLLSGSIWFVCGAWFGELELVELPSIIGQFNSTDGLYTRLSLIKNTFYTINIFLADSLLAYRLFVIWGRSTLIAVISALVWLGVVATGIAALVLTSRPQANFQASYVINLETAFFCLSISLNILCTLLIAGRLLFHQRVVRQLGSATSRTYTSIVVVIVESAAFYSICGIIYIPLMVLQTPIQFPFSSLIGTLTVRTFPPIDLDFQYEVREYSRRLCYAAHAPNLIILRLALESTAHPATVTTLDFRGFGESKPQATPASCPTQSGTSQDPPALTDSNAYGSRASIGVIDIGEGYSAERLLRDRKKAMV